MLFFGTIQAAKLFHITLAVAAASVSAAALWRLTTWSRAMIWLLSITAAADPVFLYQYSSYYQDRLLASLVTILFGACVLFAQSPRLSPALIIGRGVILLVNIKFTGLAYAVVFLAGTVAVTWFRFGVRKAIETAAIFAGQTILAVAVIGYAPYTRNTIEHSHPLSPLMGRNSVDIVTELMPANLIPRDRVSRFVLANLPSPRIRSIQLDSS